VILTNYTARHVQKTETGVMRYPVIRAGDEDEDEKDDEDEEIDEHIHDDEGGCVADGRGGKPGAVT
jgi:hypothetical protein